MTSKVVAFEPKFYVFRVSKLGLFSQILLTIIPVRIRILISVVKKHGILCVTVINHGVQVRLLPIVPRSL